MRVQVRIGLLFGFHSNAWLNSISILPLFLPLSLQMAAAEERIAMVRAAHAEVHSHVRLAQQLVQRISHRR